MATRSLIPRATPNALTIVALCILQSIHSPQLGAQPPADAIVRSSAGTFVGRVKIADLESQRAGPDVSDRSGRPEQMLDSMRVHRSADRACTLRLDADTLRLRVGEPIGLPKLWAVDCAGYIVVDFVPLRTVPRELTGDRDRRSVFVKPGRFTATVRPMRLGPNRPTDPEATLTILVSPQ